MIRAKNGGITVSFLCAVLVVTLLLCVPDPFVPEQYAPEIIKDNNIPTVTVTICEDAVGFGTVEEMNASADHSVRCTGTMRIDVPKGYKGDFSEKELSGTGELTLDYIRGRGNSTWLLDKKPYKCKLRRSADLLGLGDNRHWVLLASRHDNSLMRNRIVSFVGQRMGMEFTVKGLPVDLVINGEYLGSYYICQDVRLDAGRVELDRLQNTDSKEPEITGGYLLSLKPSDSKPQFTTQRGTAFGFVSPEFDGTNGTEAQKRYISDYLQKVENAVYGENCCDENGVSVFEYMDLQAAADYWWMQEFFDNIDAFSSDSTYLYKKRNGKLCWGPLWDFDISLYDRNAYDRPFRNGTSDWFDRLRAESPEFREMLRERWKLLSGIIAEVTADGGVIDRYAAETENSWRDDIRLYPADMLTRSPRIPYKKEIINLKRVMNARKDWIDKHLDDEFLMR